ncbi:GntR family transcriptional regulator [Kitasatospora sp. NPDC059327]|uniref:GntR family transcriptional regulator n=1 Tax=Kitasatospora sp. NPDC059327 TaxID=3346803 RepID=UPI003674A5C9
MTQPMQPYMRIVEAVKSDIRSGKLATDAKLPSTRELAETFDVATGTVQRALSQLKTDSWVYSHQGLGSFVRGIPVEDSGSLEIARLAEQLAQLEQRVAALEDNCAQQR